MLARRFLAVYKHCKAADKSENNRGSKEKAEKMDDTTKKDATRLEKVATGITVGESADTTPAVNADITNKETSDSEINDKEQLKDGKDTKRRGRPPKKISDITEKSNVKIDKFLVMKNSAFEKSSKVQRSPIVTRTRYTVEPSDGENESIDDPSEEESDVTVINIMHSESFDNGECEREQEKLREQTERNTR